MATEEDKRISHGIIDEIQNIYRANLDKDESEQEGLFFWDKPNARRHLKERKERKHLPDKATMKEYNDIITKVLIGDVDLSLHEDPNKYVYGQRRIHNGDDWIVVLTPERK